jgi:hypothetical protein
MILVSDNKPSKVFNPGEGALDYVQGCPRLRADYRPAAALFWNSSAAWRSTAQSFSAVHLTDRLLACSPDLPPAIKYAHLARNNNHLDHARLRTAEANLRLGNDFS